MNETLQPETDGWTKHLAKTTIQFGGEEEKRIDFGPTSTNLCSLESSHDVGRFPRYPDTLTDSGGLDPFGRNTTHSDLSQNGYGIWRPHPEGRDRDPNPVCHLGTARGRGGFTIMRRRGRGQSGGGASRLVWAHSYDDSDNDCGEEPDYRSEYIETLFCDLGRPPK